MLAHPSLTITPHVYHSPYTSPTIPSTLSIGSSISDQVAVPPASGSYLHGTLVQIETLANNDVEMQPPIDESNHNYAAFVVVDTNILLHRFEVLTQFVDDVERNGLPVIVIIPSVVVSELDGQKNRSELAWFARRASSWLLAKIRERKHVKGQARTETSNSIDKWMPRNTQMLDAAMKKTMYNDSLILDCWLYFSQTGTPTFLCSNDKNLCIATASENMALGAGGIIASDNMFFTLSEHGGSREIARNIYGNSIDLTHFNVLRGYRKGRSELAARPVKEGIAKSVQEMSDVAATPVSITRVKAPKVKEQKQQQPLKQPIQDHDDMMMDVDDEGGPDMPMDTMEWKSEQEINMLHEAVIDYFSRVLVDLVGKVGGAAVRHHDSKGLSASRHAPRRRHYTEWSVAECIEYLVQEARNPKREGGAVHIKQNNPRLEVFLLKPYKGVRGSRPGQEWSRQDWKVALNNLRQIGSAWRDDSIAESLGDLEPYVDQVFKM